MGGRDRLVDDKEIPTSYPNCMEQIRQQNTERLGFSADDFESALADEIEQRLRERGHLPPKNAGRLTRRLWALKHRVGLLPRPVRYEGRVVTPLHD